MLRNRLRAASALAGALATGLAAQAKADGLDTPAGGVVQVGRGGAWVARADDPLAAFVNPAAMVRNPNGVHVGSHLMFREHCFERLGEGGLPVAPGPSLAPAPGPVCADIAPFPNPQVAIQHRLSSRVWLGFAAVGPHKHGKATWPDIARYKSNFHIENQPHPAPQRYLMLDDDALLVNPTVSVAVALRPNLSLGVGLVWGIAKFQFSNMVAGTGVAPERFDQDIKSTIDGFDGFIPGLILSALYSPTRRVDIAGTFRYSDAIRANTNLKVQPVYYTLGGDVNAAALSDPNLVTEREGAATFRFNIPMEARLGFRYHHPRASGGYSQPWVAKHGKPVRDAMSQDLFDVEVDLTYANTSAVDRIEIRLGSDIPINLGPGLTVSAPTNADMPRNWRDTLGVRLGGELVAIPDLLAVRAGGFFESKAVADADLSLDFHQGYKAGVGGGATLRLSRFDISAAYQHTFYGALDNGGAGNARGLSGNPTKGFRTDFVVNGGRATSSLDEVALGVTVHY
jgi:long-chain fatty acid transport protein